MLMTERYDSLFRYYAQQYGGLDPKLLKAQATQESELNPDAQSGAGAQGLTQFEPATFLDVAANLKLKHASVWNPEHAIQCQAAFMRDLFREFREVRLALAAYNWGPGHLKAWQDSGQGPEAWPEETRDYVERIQTLMDSVTV